MKKQLISTLLIGVLVVSLTACTSNNTDTKEAQAVITTAAMVTDKPDTSKNSQEAPSTDTQEAVAAQTESKDTTLVAVQPTSAPSQTVKSKTTPSQTAKPKATPSQKPSGGAKVSEYFSNAPATSIDTIQISPKHVYYKDSKLYMDAFVYNGFSHAVFDIKNVGIQLSNKAGIISESTFGALENQTINPQSYIVWTFVFNSDTVKQPNANLDFLNTKYECDNSY